MGAGDADGIAISAEFTVYSHPDKLFNLNSLGTFVVERLWPFKSDMRPPTSSIILPSQGAFAIQTKAREVKPFRLYIPPDDSLHRQYHSILADLQGFDLVDNPEEAHLKVFTSPQDDCLVFMHMDERVTRHGMNLVKDGVKLNSVIVRGVLESAARYFRELNRTTASHDIVDLIEVEFYKLHVPNTHVAGRSIIEVLKPVGPNLCCENKVIDFEVEDSDDPKTPYGFKIINKAKDHLYVNAFYFDNTDFGIGEFQCSLPSART